MLKDFPRLKDDEPGPAEKYNTSAAEEDRLRAGMVLVRASGESWRGDVYASSGRSRGSLGRGSVRQLAALAVVGCGGGGWRWGCSGGRVWRGEASHESESGGGMPKRAAATGSRSPVVQ
jgi:hypothetical protein